MPTQNDFREFLKLLNENDVDFVILGGYAVAFHGHVRNTQDLDILFRADDCGVQGVLASLRSFGFPESAISGEELACPGNIIRMGIPPVRIELMNQVDGVAFDEVWEERVKSSYGDVPVAFIGLEQLLRNKSAAGRPKDMADLHALSKMTARDTGNLGTR